MKWCACFGREKNTIFKIGNLKPLSVRPSVLPIATPIFNTMTTTGPAPADTNGPPLLAPDYPSLPKLTSTGWVTPPPFLPPESNDPERLARREANHQLYHQTGDQLTWYHYVLFGYYLFDCVEDFEKAWNPEQNHQYARFRIMWDSFHKNRMSKILSSPLLTMMWANNYAKPYLHQHEPDYLLATEILYEDCVNNAAADSLSLKEQSWTEIGQHRRGKTSKPSSSPSSPRPTSPTITWSPEDYDHLAADSSYQLGHYPYNHTSTNVSCSTQLSDSHRQMGGATYTRKQFLTWRDHTRQDSLFPIPQYKQSSNQKNIHFRPPSLCT
jgi:hypothetical protein